MADIESTPPRKQRQRRPPLVGATKLFDGDPEVYVDTKAAVGMINAQFGAITSPADLGAMRNSGTGPGFVKLGQYVRYKSVDAAIILPRDVGRVLEHRAVQVDAVGAGKRPGAASRRSQRAVLGSVAWLVRFAPAPVRSRFGPRL